MSETNNPYQPSLAPASSVGNTVDKPRSSFIRRILTALATGYVVYFFSETLFWGRFNPETPQEEFIQAWIFVYSTFAYMMLTVISRFRVRSFWAIFLAGAVYGWVAEGIFVQTMYDSFPLHISFTGLAWHALLSVCGGWYLLRHTLAHGTVKKLALVSIALGLFWGVWSVFWWIEHGAKTPLEDWVAYATLSGVLLVIALAVENRVQPKEFGATAWEAWILLAIAVAWFAFITVVVNPFSVFILPPLMGLVFYALRKNRRCETQPDVLYELKTNISWYRYLIVLLLPMTAIFVYGLFWLIGQGVPTNWVVYILSTPAGFILLGISLYKVLRRETPKPVQSEPQPQIAT